MSIIKENQLSSNIFFVTLKIINNLPIFTNEKYFKIILDSLSYCRKEKGWRIYAYTILINHLHLVLRILSRYNLDDTIRDFKSFTAKEILKLLHEDKQWDIIKEMEITARNTKKQDFKVWERNIYPVAIITEKFFLQKVNYTDLNAEKHGIVNDIEKYPYTSYHNHYCSHEVALKLDKIREIL